MMNPFDVCRCGDYRHQHVNGEGSCMLRELCVLGKCSKFEFSELQTAADQKLRAAAVPTP